MKPQHTPTPWTYSKDRFRNQADGTSFETYLIADSEKIIATLIDNESDAAFIVRAVNSHERLVKAVKGMLENYLHLKRMSLILARSNKPNWMSGLDENEDVHVIAVKKALAKAEGKGE